MVQKSRKFQNCSCFSLWGGGGGGGRHMGMGQGEAGTAEQSRGTSSLCRSSGTEGKTSGTLLLI